MPGKVNPVIPEAVSQVVAQVYGNDTAVAFAGSQGNFELNVYLPVMARNLLESIRLLTNVSRLFADRCIAGIEADRDRCRQLADRSLAVATALNGDLGYERVEQIVKEAHRTGDSVRTVASRSGVDDEVLDRALDLDRIARGDRRDDGGSASG
jgi:fumarate hydratase class II